MQSPFIRLTNAISCDQIQQAGTSGWLSYPHCILPSLLWFSMQTFAINVKMVNSAGDNMGVACSMWHKPHIFYYWCNIHLLPDLSLLMWSKREMMNNQLSMHISMACKRHSTLYNVTGGPSIYIISVLGELAYAYCRALQWSSSSTAMLHSLSHTLYLINATMPTWIVEVLWLVSYLVILILKCKPNWLRWSFHV